MKKTTVLIFVAGAVSGWAAAQKTLNEANSWDKGFGELSNDWQPPEAADSTPDEREKAPTPIATRDPFRAAFQGAQAEIAAHAGETLEPGEEVA